MSKPEHKVWEAEADARLRHFWDEGHSTAEIGRRMGISKNSVVGRAHRLKLTPRANPTRVSADWTDELDAILRKCAIHRIPLREAAKSTGRSVSACSNRAGALGLKFASGRPTVRRGTWSSKVSQTPRLPGCSPAAAGRRAVHSLAPAAHPSPALAGDPTAAFPRGTAQGRLSALHGVSSQTTAPPAFGSAGASSGEGCRYIGGDPLQGARHCDAPRGRRLDGLPSSYCPHHHALCHVPPERDAPGAMPRMGGWRRAA
jgi:hypothetical protein